MHIQDPEQRRWIQDRVETAHAKPRARGAAAHPRHRLNQAEAFETFLQTKFVGQKRFSLEGAESTDRRCSTPILDAAAARRPRRGRHRHAAPRPAQRAGQHRRQVATPRSSASSRASIDPRTAHGSGDVKYHLGAEGTFTSLRRRQDPGVAGVQPVATSRRSTRCSRASSGPSRTGSTRARARRLHRPAGAAARRRRVRRPGRGGRDAEPVPAARLPHRRHRPRRRQQPGRLHHRPGVSRVERCTPPTWPG